MPLSEHEQRLLDEIEHALYAEDPKFASSVRSARARHRVRRSALFSVLGIVAGLTLILVGLFSAIVALSVVGFVLLVAGIGYGVQTLRRRGTASSGGAPSTATRDARSSGGLRSRMEERMRRRFDEN